VTLPGRCGLTDEKAARTRKVGSKDKMRQAGLVSVSAEMLN